MKHILFVCTGNTCRSPMAEAILKNKQLDGVQVKSAGIYAANGSEAATHAKQVLQNKAIPSEHRSRLLTSAEVYWADLILTMTASHKWAIEQQFPQAAGKVHTLKGYTGEAIDQDVVDPYGGSLGMYEATYRELEEFIEKAIEKLNEMTDR